MTDLEYVHKGGKKKTKKSKNAAEKKKPRKADQPLAGGRAARSPAGCGAEEMTPCEMALRAAAARPPGFPRRRRGKYGLKKKNKKNKQEEEIN